jgi:hypothetical protein
MIRHWEVNATLQPIRAGTHIVHIMAPTPLAFRPFQVAIVMPFVAVSDSLEDAAAGGLLQRERWSVPGVGEFTLSAVLWVPATAVR